MVYQSPDQDIDQEQKTGQTSPNTPAASSPTQISGAGGNVTSGSSGSVASTGNGGTGPATSTAKPTSSGQFTNIQNYLNANTGAGEKLGQKVQGNLQNQEAQTQNQFGQAQNQFNQQSEQAYQPFQNGQSYASDLIQNAGKDNLSPQQVQQFQKVSSGQYSGPTDINNFAQIQQGAVNNQQTANLGQTESGRFALLQNMFNNQKGQYTQGQQTLDNLLLQRGGGANLAAAKQQANQSLQAINQGRATAQQTAQQNTQGAQQIGQAVQNQLSGAQNTFNTDLNNRVTAAQQNQDQLYQQLQQQLPTNQLSQQLYDNLSQGLGINTDTRLYNVNPGQYVTEGINPTAQTLANSQDYAKYNALQQLAGQDPTLLNNASLAGTYNAANPFSYDQSAFQGALGLGQQKLEQDAGYQTDLKNAANWQTGVDLYGNTLTQGQTLGNQLLGQLGNQTDAGKTAQQLAQLYGGATNTGYSTLLGGGPTTFNGQYGSLGTPQANQVYTYQNPVYQKFNQTLQDAIGQSNHGGTTSTIDQQPVQNTLNNMYSQLTNAQNYSQQQEDAQNAAADALRKQYGYYQQLGVLPDQTAAS